MVDLTASRTSDDVVNWLRQASPYFRKHRGETFLIYLDGGKIAEPAYLNLVRDLVLLAAVGIRIVVVFDARSRIDERLQNDRVERRSVQGRQVIDQQQMAVIRDVVGAMRLAIESVFSFGSRGGPLGRTTLGIASGNFVSARPLGIVDGVDTEFNAKARQIDVAAVEARLEAGEIVLLPPIGYAGDGELYSIDALELASFAASELAAGKLILLGESEGIVDEHGDICRQLTLTEAEQFCERIAASAANNVTVRQSKEFLAGAVNACRAGVERVHILKAAHDGAVLRELFTRDGIGSMVSNVAFDQLRGATRDDIAGILDLIAPLQQSGVLVERSPEAIEASIDDYVVLVREDTIVACGALHDFSQTEIGGESGAASASCGEIACVAVHADYRGDEFGDNLLEALERRARKAGLERLFVLTTQAAQWFGERGYQVSHSDELPSRRRASYDEARNSAVLAKDL